MGKFLSLIEQMMPKSTTYSDGEVDIMRRSKKKVETGESQDPEDQKLAKKYDELQGKKKELVRKASQITTEADGDEIDPRQDKEGSGDGIPENPEEILTKISSAAEVFYVDLAKKSLHVDMDQVNLPEGMNELILSDVTPENAKQVATAIRKIVDDFGLSA